MSNRKTALLVTKLLVSSGLLFLLYRKTPLADIKGLLAAVDLRLLLVVMAMLLLNTVISAVKWRIFLLRDEVDLPLSRLVFTYLIGGFFNVFLPSNIGGDSYRIYDVSRQSRETMRSLVSVFADRVSGFVALVCLSLGASLIVAGRLDAPAFVLLPLSILTALMAIIWAMYKKTPVRRVLRLTRLDRFPIITRLSEKFFLSIERYGSDRGLLIRVMLISFVFQFSVIFAVYLMALSIGARASFLFFVAFVPLITLMEAIPLSIYGLGIRDVGYVFFFGWAGMSDVQTRFLALLFVATTLCYSLLGGLLYVGRLLSARVDSRPLGPDPSPKT